MRESKTHSPQADTLSPRAVGRRLRAWRKASGLEIIDLANGIGEDRNQISQWETGRSRPSVPVMWKMFSTFSLPSDYLLFGAIEALPGRLIPLVSAELAELDTLENTTSKE